MVFFINKIAYVRILSASYNTVGIQFFHDNK